MNQIELKEKLITRLTKLLLTKPLLFGYMYFPHHFRKNSPQFHSKILNVALTCRKLVIAAPRESAKSTIILFLYLIHTICFRKRRTIIILSNTYKKAAKSLETIKEEFKTNKQLIKDFGVKIVKDSFGDSIFEHKNGFRIGIECFGAEQMGNIRGTKLGAYRPDLILVDDLEDDEMVRNPDRRRELAEDFDSAVVLAGEGQITQIIVIGTILHDDSMMAKLISKEFYPEFRKLKYQGRYQYENKYYSIWPEWKSVEELNELEKEKPAVFAKEIQNDPVSGMMSNIKRDDFRYWTIENNKYILFDEQSRITHTGYLYECKAAISCDLAWEDKRTSDFCVIMPGLLTPQSDLLIDTYMCKKGVRPSEIIETLFAWETRYRAITGGMVPIGFEKAKLEKVIKHLVKLEMRKRNHWLVFKDLLWDKDKNERIITRLQPRYHNHSIYHKRGMGDLEHQLIRVPHGTHDDLPDAEQGLVQLLEYAKTSKTPVTPDNHFEWLRKLTQKNKSGKPGSKYKFGKKKKKDVIPAKESYC